MDEKSEDTNAPGKKPGDLSASRDGKKPRKQPVDLSAGREDTGSDTDADDVRVLASGVAASAAPAPKASSSSTGETGIDEGQTGLDEEESWADFGKFVLKLALVVLIFRSFIFSPFSIPSESMLPRLWNGDYLLAAKWPYGFSKYSMPFNMPVIPGRIFASEPKRGDVVIFKHPVDDSDYIKRVIGLPGDSIAVSGGEVILNGEPIVKERIADFVIPVSPNTDCAWGAVEERAADGGLQCRYARFSETLPGGKTYDVLDFGRTPADDYGPIIVPEGRLFLMGDNRDNSQDSRTPAAAGAGIGLVPQDKLVGRATVIMCSTDGGAEWLKPWTWFSAARWDRLLDGL